MNPAFKTAAWIVLGASVAVEPAGASPSCTPLYHIDVTLDPGEGTLRGSMEIETCGESVLWLYPNRLAEPPGILDAMNAYWIYPHHPNPGRMEILTDHEHIDLPAGHPLAGIDGMAVKVPAADGVAKLEYEATIPKRYGAFGRARGGVLMVAGWHPMLAGQDLESPPPPALFDIRLRAPGGYEIVLGGTTLAGGKTAEYATGPVGYVPLAAYPRLETSEAECLGTIVRWHGLDGRPAMPDFEPGSSEVLGLPDTLPDIMAYDRPLMAMEVACRTVEILGDAVRPGSVVDLVEAPLRLEIATPTWGPVFVSDRIFDILPARKAWKFHEFALARAIASSLVERTSPGAGFTPDFVAAEVVERYTDAWHGAAEDMRDILKYGAFLAAIDYFLYSPLVEFREAYFFTVAEQDWLRDEPWAFMNRLPRGKLYHDKLVDLVGADAVDRVVDGFLAGKGSVLDLAAKEAGEDLGWFWDQWSRAYPSLNYRVTDVRSKPLAGGLERHEALIVRDGDSVREPVKVRFVLEGGATADAVWPGDGSSGTVSIEAEEDLDSVIVDPDFRLFEDPSITKNHPRFDNYSTHPWRPPVFTALALTSNITDLSGNLDITFDMRRKFDIVEGIRMRIVAATWGQGATVWYTRGFGPKRDLDHAAWYVGTWITGFHHSSPYGWHDEGGWHGGTAFSTGIYLTHDDRFYFWNPTGGWQASLSLGYSLGVDDNRWSPDGLRHSLWADARGFYLWTPAGGHTFAIYGGASGVFVDPYRGQLGSLSSHEILRGFDADETFGRVLLYACAEYRHTFVQSLDVNLLQLVTLQGIQGVLFAGVGSASREDSYRGLFAPDRMFTEVGYGLRGILAYFGSYPGIVAVDLAVPITPLHRPGRLPLAIQLAFNHVF